MNRGERQELISSMYGRVRELNAAPENLRRNILIKQLNAEVTFMHYGNLLNGTEYHKLLDKIASNEERKYDAKEKDAVYRMLAYNNSMLLDLYTSIRCIYEKYDFYYHNMRFNEHELEEAFKAFLDYVGLSTLYKEIKENKMFLHGANKIKKGQRGICLAHEELSYIILGQIRRDQYEYYIDLIYEIAIAYVNKILHYEKLKGSANIQIGETPIEKLTFDEYKCFYYFIPPTFCRIFFDFLLEEKVFDITKVLLMRSNNEILNYEKLLQAFEVCSLIERKAGKIKDSSTYEAIIRRVGKNISPLIEQEAIGSIASCKLFADYKENHEEFLQDLSYLIKKIRKLNLSKLLSTYCSIDSQEKNKRSIIEEIVDENLGRSYVKK